MTPRFLLVPGYVRSVNDGDRHYVGIMALARLYELRPSEWVAYREGVPMDAQRRGLEPLYPRRDGKYGRPAVLDAPEGEK